MQPQYAKHPQWCKTTMIVFIMTTRVGKVTIFHWQVPEQGRFPQAPYNPTNANNPNFLPVLDSYSSKQAIIQMTLNAILEHNGSNKAATIPWLDHVKMVAENTGIDPLKVGICKLKGLALGDITAIQKEGHLTCIVLDNN